MEISKEIYTQSVVAFIDILGFKNALEDQSKISDILDVLTHVKAKIERLYSDPAREKFQGVVDIELTAFSDSIVISGSESQVVFVLFASLEFSQLLFGKGFFVGAQLHVEICIIKKVYYSETV